MADAHPVPSSAPEPHGERLDSWKDIAAYLKRDVRTVQRWERIDGLPVHRHRTPGIGGVYAFKPELDAWWQPRVQASPPDDHPRMEAWIRRPTLAWFGFSALLIVVIAVTGWGVLRLNGLIGPASDLGSVQAVRQWEGPELTFTTSIAADARHVFYTDWTRGDLVVLDPATGMRRRLTRHTTWFHPHDRHEWATDPKVSPDGTQVAFSWGKGNLKEIHLARVDGGGSRPIHRSEATIQATPYEWSRDGRSLLAVMLRDGSSSSTLVLMSASDGTIAFEKQIERRPERATLSPDGRFIAYDRPSVKGEQDRDIWLISTATGKETPLVEHPAYDTAPVWSADASQVLFLSDRTGVAALWSQRIAAGSPQGQPEVVKHDMARAWPMGIDADGVLSYAVIESMEDVLSVDLDPRSLMASGPGISIAPQAVGMTRGATWSPDGARLAYLKGGVYDSNRLHAGAAESTLVIRLLATGAEREIQCALTSLTRPRWSPDGRSILIAGAETGQRPTVYRVDVDTGKATAVVPPSLADRPRQLCWAGASTAVFYKYWGGPVIVRQIDTGQERTVSPPADDTVSLSPDGRSLAYSTHDAASGRVSLMVIALDSTVPRELVRMTMPDWISAMTWAPDGQRVVYAKGRRDAAAGELIGVSLDDPRPVSLGVKTHRVLDVQVRPDGRQLAYHEIAIKGAIWRLSHALLPPSP
ncbi:MAG: hypothetical protein NTY02_10240 [Acidobacteria bacterium]|nr:hypothetical protein [Acidobacteriota bacterium]